MSKQSNESTNSAGSTFLGIVVILLCLGVVGAMVSLFGGSGGGGGGSSGGSSSGGGSSSDVVVVKPYELGNGMYVNIAQDYSSPNSISGIQGGNLGGNSSAGIWAAFDKEDDNGVLRISKNKNTEVSQMVIIDSKETSGDKYIIETDFKWSGSVNGIYGVSDPGWYFAFHMSDFWGNDRTNLSSLYFVGSANENIFYVITSNDLRDAPIAYFRVDDWNNIRIEYEPLTNRVELYVNNWLVHEFISDVESDSEFGVFVIENRGKAYDSVITLDNTYVSAVTTN